VLRVIAEFLTGVRGPRYRRGPPKIVRVRCSARRSFGSDENQEFVSWNEFFRPPNAYPTIGSSAKPGRPVMERVCSVSVRPPIRVGSSCLTRTVCRQRAMERMGIPFTLDPDSARISNSRSRVTSLLG